MTWLDTRPVIDQLTEEAHLNALRRHVEELDALTFDMEEGRADSVPAYKLREIADGMIDALEAMGVDWA